MMCSFLLYFFGVLFITFGDGKGENNKASRCINYQLPLNRPLSLYKPQRQQKTLHSFTQQEKKRLDILLPGHGSTPCKKYAFTRQYIP